MNYLLASNNTILKFPYSLEELRRDNPQTSFPLEMSAEELSEWGVYSVKDQSPPEHNEHTETIELSPPSCVNGLWIREWIIIPASAEVMVERTEKKSAEIREYRDKLLASTDYTQLADYQGTDTERYKQLRQQYRDMPQQPDFPWLVVHPLLSTD